MVALVVAHTADLDPGMPAACRGLLADVFADLDETDWEHCLGGVHAIVTDRDQVIGHAAVVQRRLMHAGRALRTGYVEGVAVRADYRGQGLGAQLMAVMERVIAGAYEIGALGTTDEAVGFYQARGWVPWRGQTWTTTPQGSVRSPDDDGAVYVFDGAGPFSTALELDLDGDLTCDWRPGDGW